MNADVVIVGAGPAGIFTALEMIKKGSRQKIVMVEKGQPVEKRHCPKDISGQQYFRLLLLQKALRKLFFLYILLSVR